MKGKDPNFNRPVTKIRTFKNGGKVNTKNNGKRKNK